MHLPARTQTSAHRRPDGYYRLHELAMRRAVALRQDAIREAPAWTARALVRAARALVRWVRLHAAVLQFSKPKSHPDACVARD